MRTARYNKRMRTKGWFGPKTIGWGVTATSWQGWLVPAIFILAFAADQFTPYAGWGWPTWAYHSGRALALIVFGAVIWATYSKE